MKEIRNLLVGSIVGVGLVVGLHLLHAQGTANNLSAQQVNSMSDEQVMLQAIESVPPAPAASVPRFGTFYSAQHAPGTRMAWPPLPGSMGYGAWNLGDGVFLLDDRNVNYDELQAEADLAAALSAKSTLGMRNMNLASSYAYGNRVYLTNMAAVSSGYGNVTASFSIAGGTNFVPYDILMSTNVATPFASWNWLGIGYTSNRYSFSGQPADNAFYILAKPAKTMTVAWGDDYYGESDVPTGITNAVMVAGGYEQGLALLADGTIKTMGLDFYNRPTNLTGVAMVACGWNHDLALLTNGTVAIWGYSNLYSFEFNMPANLTNAVVISAQAYNSLVLCSNGTLVAWGDNTYGQTNIPSGLTNVTAIACGGNYNLAVRADGTVTAWGSQTSVPSGLSNVVDVAAGWAHSVALKSDGTVTAWGNNSYGQINIPAALTNAVAIAAGGFPNYSGYTMILAKDGTVATFGDNYMTAPLGGLNHVVSIGGGFDCGYAIRSGPPTPVITLEPIGQFQIAGGNVAFTAKGEGLYGVTYQWQTNGVNIAGATNATLTLANVQAAQQAAYAVVVTDNGGAGSIASSNASFVLVTQPVITSQTPLPTNQVAAFQTNLTLSVTATAPGQSNGFPITYQWQFNGTNIGSATSNSYSFLVGTNSPGTYSVIVANSAGSTSAAWQVTMTYVGSYIAPGTLAYYLSTNAMGYANGYSATYSNMLELANWTSATYSGTNLALLTNAVWSTNCWLHGVQGLSATCIGYSNGFSGIYLVTMVSPRHYLRAQHIGPLSSSTLIAFLDTNNILYWRTAVQEVQVGSSDTDVGILNADLPSSVGYLPVIPVNFTNYLPTTSYSYVQGIGLHQDLSLISQPMTFVNPFVIWDSSVAPPFGLGTSWNVAFFSGDSSNPEMLLIGNQFVLTTHNWHSTDGPNYAYQIGSINQQMHYLSTNNVVGTDYQLTSYSLTNWPTIH